MVAGLYCVCLEIQWRSIAHGQKSGSIVCRDTPTKLQASLSILPITCRSVCFILTLLLYPLHNNRDDSLIKCFLLIPLQVYSCSADGTVKLWDFIDGILIKVRFVLWKRQGYCCSKYFHSLNVVFNFFTQTFIIGSPLFALYVSKEHEGVIFLHLSMGTHYKNGMYFTAELSSNEVM